MILEEKLSKSIENLDEEKLVKFLWVTVIRFLPYHKSQFLVEPEADGYMTYMFLSVQTLRETFSKHEKLMRTSKKSQDADSINDCTVNWYLGSNRETIDLISYSFSREAETLENYALPTIYDLSLAHILSRIMSYALEISLSIVEEENVNIEIYKNKVFSVLRKLQNSIFYEFPINNKSKIKVLKILIQDAVTIANDKKELNNDISWYGDVWLNWLGKLNAMSGVFWSEWFSNLVSSGFSEITVCEWDKFISVPKEIWDKSLSLSAQWLWKLDNEGEKRLNQARIIILGEKGAGKTSLARRLVNPNAPMPSKDESTEGVDVSITKLSVMKDNIPEDKDATVYIWDFAGHAITHAAHRFFLSERCLYIIVYDGRTEGRNRLGYWLDHVRNYGGKSRVIILVNLQDGHSPDIAENYFREQYEEHDCDFINFSVKDDTNSLQSFREELVDIIASGPAWDKKIPSDYFEIKEKLEEIFANNTNHISRKDFDNIAKDIDESERDLLLKSLDCLGICLWYPNIKGSELLILNPEWITRGIYRIINWLKEGKDKLATVDFKDFNDIFNNDIEVYPKSTHEFLYKLMQKYELAYKKPYYDQIVVPRCLPEDCPSKSELPMFGIDNSLYVEVTANKSGKEGPRLVFPIDTMARFIVRRSEEILDNSVWRYGALTKRGSVIALIEQDDYLIRLKINGKERRKYLESLMFTLFEVLNDYPSFASQKPEINCCVLVNEGKSTEMIPMKQVLNLAQYMVSNNLPSMFDPSRSKDISLENISMYLNTSINEYLSADKDLTNGIIERIDKMVKESSGNTTIVIGDGNTTVSGDSSSAIVNGVSVKEFNNAIKKIIENIPSNISDEDVETIKENLEVIKEQSVSKNPKKRMMLTLLDGIKAIKGTVEFAAAVATLTSLVSGMA